MRYCKLPRAFRRVTIASLLLQSPIVASSPYHRATTASFTAFHHRRDTTRRRMSCSSSLLAAEGGTSTSSPSDETKKRQGGDEGDPTIIPPLRYLGDKRLMQKQPPVTLEDLQSKEFQQQLQILPLAQKHYGGIGIAAPQVGWWTRVFCFGIDGTNPRYPSAESLPLQLWINPEITWSSSSSDQTCWMWEGCLSVPGMRGWVERPCEVKLEGLDELGHPREPQHLTGLAARIVQHEFDHLDGILFPSRVPSQTFLVPQASMDAREGWANDWPSPGAYKTPLGELCDEK